jgi:hypothetical protein
LNLVYCLSFELRLFLRQVRRKVGTTKCGIEVEKIIRRSLYGLGGDRKFHSVRH